MTPEAKEMLLEDLRQHAIGTLQEWMRYHDTPHGQLKIDWQTDGTAIVRNGVTEIARIRLTVLCHEETKSEWMPVTWGDVRERDVVRLGTTEATVVSAVTLPWHVDPNSNRYQPDPWEHEATHVHLKGREQHLTYSPGQFVEILMNQERLAIYNLSKLGKVTEIHA
jgi:hypothetical protein